MAAGDLYKPHLLLTWGGTYFGSEIWQMGVRLTLGSIDSDHVGWCAAHIDGYATDLSDWWTNASSGPSTKAVLEWVKINPIAADGKYESKTTTVSKKLSPTKTPTKRVDSPTGYTAPQVALVLSMRTGNRGPREAYGHIYMPAQDYYWNSTGPYIHDTVCSEIGVQAKTMLDAVNNLPGLDAGTGPRVCVASKRSSYVKKGTSTTVTYEAELTEVTEIWVGNVHDTQRSRTNGLRQTYQKHTLA